MKEKYKISCKIYRLDYLSTVIETDSESYEEISAEGISQIKKINNIQFDTTDKILIGVAVEPNPHMR